MRRQGVDVDVVRAFDHDLATGVWPDMTEHGGNQQPDGATTSPSQSPLVARSCVDQLTASSSYEVGDDRAGDRAGDLGADPMLVARIG
jgi:hypothetical protein